MAESKPIGGTAFVLVNGRQYALEGTLTVSPTTVVREGKAGLSGVIGYTERARVPYIEGTFATDEDLALDDIKAMRDGTVQADLANGKSYVLRNAWHAGEPEIDAAEGTVPLRWEGKDCEEIVR